MKFLIKRTAGSYTQKACEEAQGVVLRDQLVYMIEIDHLEDLIELVKREGDIILFPPDRYGDLAIEIYDDYRE